MTQTVTKICKSCGIEKALTAFRTEKLGILGRQARCIECRCAVERERWAAAPQSLKNRRLLWAEAHRELMRESDRKYRLGKHRPKKPRQEPASHTSARRAVRSAIERGELQRPDACEQCGRECKVHGHHADYSKPLEVQWLCIPCHRTVHLMMEKRGAAYLLVSGAAK